MAADPWQPALCFTGGDDCALRAWDERAPASPAWADRREHGAGVCCILPSTHTEHLVATGSYDEAARAWDLRWPGRPLLLSKARGHVKRTLAGVAWAYRGEDVTLKAYATP